MRNLSIERALALATLAGGFAAPAAAQTIQTLVIEGDSVPGVGLVTSINAMAINNAGDWLVEADTDAATTEDLVLIKNGVMVFREDQVLPGLAIPGQLSSFDDMSMNESGDFSNNFFLRNTGSTSTDSAIFWNDSFIVQESQISNATGFTAGTPYIGFFGTKVNSANQVVVMASVDDPNITSTVDRAIVFFTVDSLGNVLSETVFAKEGDSNLAIAPETFTDFGTGPHEWAFNDNGDIMYGADLTGLAATNAAIFINSLMIAREGDPSPLPGRNWLTLTSVEVDISNNGVHHVYSASLDGDAATNLVIIKDGAKFMQEGDSLAAFAPFTLTSFGSGPVLVADNGDVLWFGDWNDPLLSVDTGIFINDQLLVQEGVTQIGGVTVTTIRGIQDGYSMSRDGRYVVFEAILANGNEGVFMIDRQTGPEAICFGDGSGTLCPCGNTGAPGEGCANSNGMGGILAASGSTSIVAGDLVLSGSQLDPNQAGLYYQGDNALNGGNGIVFGDGLRCAGGNVRRIQTVQASAGGVSSTSVNVAVQGAVSPGDVRVYQLWYRNPVGSPCGTTFNFTNAMRVTWDA